jgi:alpha/beta superfamily hydrolase
MKRVLIDGPVGQIEIAIDGPAAPRGLALIAHPHPLFGGTLENKIVTTLARCFKELGYLTLRPNFRGVGASQGEHDHGIGETEDLLAVVRWGRVEFGALPWVLAGFSFGAFVQTRVAHALQAQGEPAARMVLVGAAAGEVRDARAYQPEAVPADTLVIHGEQDDTVPLANVLDWARPQGLPVVVVPGVDHFFHGKLTVIRQLVMRAFGAAGGPA